jgi:hypothetical protein
MSTERLAFFPQPPQHGGHDSSLYKFLSVPYPGWRPGASSSHSAAARSAATRSAADLGAAIGRTAGVRHAVSLVRRAVDRREGFRRVDLLQEPPSRTRSRKGFCRRSSVCRR